MGMEVQILSRALGWGSCASAARRCARYGGYSLVVKPRFVEPKSRVRFSLATLVGDICSINSFKFPKNI